MIPIIISIATNYLSELVGDMLWQFIICHDISDKLLGFFFTKNHQMPSNVTKYHHITIFYRKCYHPDGTKCHQVNHQKNHQKSFNLTWWHLMTCHDLVKSIDRGKAINWDSKTDSGSTLKDLWNQGSLLPVSSNRKRWPPTHWPNSVDKMLFLTAVYRRCGVWNYKLHVHDVQLHNSWVNYLKDGCT